MSLTTGKRRSVQEQAVVGGGKAVISHLNTKNANYLFIVSVLKEMLGLGSITQKEYLRAKNYYLKLTGADIVLAD
jgi:hypothetical protein